MANDFDVYVDNVRVYASSEEDCQRTLRRIMSVAQALGMQDARTQRRCLNRGSSPWAESITQVKEDGVYVTVSNEKWKRGQDIVSSWLNKYYNSTPRKDVWFNLKDMEKGEGISNPFRTYIP